MGELNQKLESLYLSKMDHLSKMYAELKQLGQSDYSWPLLLHVWEEDYSKAPIKLMIIGQEPNGWDAELTTAEDVVSSMAVYEHFDMGRNYNSIFWRWARKINQQLGNPNTNCFVWNNILKFGKECEKGRPDRRITEFENRYCNIIADEIAILNPDVCIFLTGPSYDNDIKAKFPDVEFVEFGGYKDKNEVAWLKSEHLPPHSYRTYHPGAGRFWPKWYPEVFEIISRTVRKDLLGKE